MIDPTNAVTWTEIGALSGVFGMVIVGFGGFLVRQMSALGKRVESQRDEIESNHREVIRYYATQQMVAEVERRLTESVNVMASHISTGMQQMTERIEQLFRTVLDDHRRRDAPPP